MSDLKEQAKKIIAKGKLLNDVELINMGLDMLESIATSDNAVEPVKEIPTTLINKFDITDQFRVKKESVISAKYGKKVSVLVGERNNKFIDDGNDSSELKGKTPDFKPAERSRKAKTVSATCQVCGKVEKVNEIFTIGREVYRCESCLLKGKS